MGRGKNEFALKMWNLNPGQKLKEVHPALALPVSPGSQNQRLFRRLLITFVSYWKISRTRESPLSMASMHHISACFNIDLFLPVRNIQQEYQTFFHHSFRVSTYLPGNVRLKDLIEACPGIKVYIIYMSYLSRSLYDLVIIHTYIDC